MTETIEAGRAPVAEPRAEKHIVPGASWQEIYARAQAIAPEAFGPGGHVLNLIGGRWGYPGRGKVFLSPCDGTPLCMYPMIDLDAAKEAVRLAAAEHERWSQVDLDERRARVAACIAQLAEYRELLAYLLTWEVGKPYAQSLVSVDRCVSGVEWYLDGIEEMLEGRTPLGLISNIASWNYPMSVLMHSLLVQMLAGNAVIAKTPTDGGLCVLTLACALARRAELPVTLLSGSGGQLGDALVRGDEVACLAFVGGKSNGRDIAASLYDRNKRYMLEMEGINTYGIWNFSDWDGLATQLRKSFEFGKQRCTAYARYVIQRELLPKFLAAYLPLLNSLKIGHPLMVEGDQTEPPKLDSGPLIHSRAVEELETRYMEAIGKGAISLYEGELDESLFFPLQDTSAYLAPRTLTNLPRNCDLYHNEPFGPVDTIVIVDRIEELVAEMNVSNGNLVASVACDDPRTALRIGGELRAFKTGINKVRSRGDREEPFGGLGESWKGCYVGGRYLVQAVTVGPPGERLYGNFPDYTLLPETR